MTQNRKRERDKPSISTSQDGPTSHNTGLNSRKVATTVLTRVVDDGRNLDALCDRQHGLNAFLSLEEKDRALVRAIAITALRNRRKIDAALKKLMSRPPPRNARFLIHTLHVAAAQILFMDIPESAAVNLAVTAIKKDKRTTRFASLTNAVLRRMAREKPALIEFTADLSPLPDWLSKQVRQDYGKENAKRISNALLQPDHLDLSVKNDPAHWANVLGGIVLPTGSVRLNSSEAVQHLEGFAEGEWWVQDAAAALPAHLIKADKGAKVLELCAAPGGKTAQLANHGYDVTALDISKPRVARLEDNLKRLGLKAQAVCADMMEWEPDEKFDAVLIDAPCSSTGTLRRHPDVMWAKQAEDISSLAALQFTLLERAATFVKPGGCLVFANCSMLKKEGEDLLARALKADLGLSPSAIQTEEVFGLSDLINGQGAIRSLPFHTLGSTDEGKEGMDGFFACRFERT